MLQRALGMFLWASIISTTGPSFPTFRHLNIHIVLEGCQEGNWGPSRPHWGAKCMLWVVFLL